MDSTVLIVTAINGAENLASAISSEANAIVEVAHSRRAALARLRRGPVTALVLDTSMPTTETTSSAMLWQNGGTAIPLEIHLPSIGFAGVTRLLRNVMDGRELAHAAARREAASAVACELRGTVTSLLLESEMILRDKEMSPAIADRVMHLRSLADTLRTRLLPAH